MPEGVESGILSGLYLVRKAEESGGDSDAPRVQLFGSGALLPEVLSAADALGQDFGVRADVWSVTSYTELARNGAEADRWNRLNPNESPRRGYLAEQLDDHPGPVVAVTDYVRAHAEQVRGYVGRSYTVLGTDGWGRSDTRDRLRRFFEVDQGSTVVAVLHALSEIGQIDRQRVAEAIAKYGIDGQAPPPVSTHP